MARITALSFAIFTVLLLAVGPGTSTAAREGVRDCGDVTSKGWVRYVDTATDVVEYRSKRWFVFAGVGLQPSCEFAHHWARLAVREAVHDPDLVYRRPVSRGNTPPGWKCIVFSGPKVVRTTGGILQCLRYKRGKIVGSFSAGPNVDEKDDVF